jgi:hypothetical protein
LVRLLTFSFEEVFNMLKLYPHCEEVKKVNIRAAHNRAVKWYQEIRKLPPAKRVGELQKWEDFVMQLPIEDSDI